MTLYELIRNIQHRERLGRILEVFSEQGFGYLISKVDLQGHVPFKKRLQALISREKATKPAERLRHAFEQLGPTFVKFGQLLSLRPDLIPYEYAAEFEKMQDKVPAFPFLQAKKIIETELGRPLNKIFTSFNKTPIASASIAQVYKAKIGKKSVAVKVQRPKIRKTIKTDIELMYKLAGLLEERAPELGRYHLKSIVHEFEKWTIKELNFRIEAYYSGEFAKNFQGSKTVVIPKCYLKISAEKVLVMDFIEGMPLHELQNLEKKDHKKTGPKTSIEKIIKKGYEAFIKQAFIDGLFHADPHPGNILILKDGRIGLIDFGIVGHFDSKLKQSSLDFFRCILNNDPEKAANVVLRMSPAEGEFDRRRFYSDFKEIFEQLQYTSLKDIRASQIVKEALEAAQKHQLSIPTDFVLYGKTLITLEGVAFKYYPEFNFFNESRTILSKLLDRTYFAKEIISKTKDKISEYKELAETFPETAAEILEKAKRFTLNIDIEDKDVKNLTLEIERSSGNIALGFIIAALIVASALIMLVGVSAYAYIGGFMAAGILTLWLIHRTIFVKIARKG
ncbi:MAG: AarF/ABC1/UbiB kinase family protein [Nanoarchaeota archaeon]